MGCGLGERGWGCQIVIDSIFDRSTMRGWLWLGGIGHAGVPRLLCVDGFGGVVFGRLHKRVQECLLWWWVDVEGYKINWVCVVRSGMGI